MSADSSRAIIGIIKKELPHLQEQFGVERIGLYGSFARGDFNEDSDVDILVSLTKPLGLSFIQLANYLEERIGRKVDLITSGTLERGLADPRKAHIAKEIQETVVYV